MADDYPENSIKTFCDGQQTWVITSPQYPGTTHTIKSMFCNDGDGKKLPSSAVREYMADVAQKVAEMADWGGGGGP